MGFLYGDTPRLHYDTPDPTLRCSYGGLKTTDKNKVTCKNCLYRMLKKTFGRPPKRRYSVGF